MHKSRVAQGAIRECKFEQLNHPPYSSELATCDYYLFRNLKSHLRGTRFFGTKQTTFISKAYRLLKRKLGKCIVVKGGGAILKINVICELNPEFYALIEHSPRI